MSSGDTGDVALAGPVRGEQLFAALEDTHRALRAARDMHNDAESVFHAHGKSAARARAAALERERATNDAYQAKVYAAQSFEAARRAYEAARAAFGEWYESAPDAEVEPVVRPRAAWLRTVGFE